MTVFPKHVTPPNNDNKVKGIVVIESIQNPFKVTLYPIQDIREILSLASGKARVRAGKSYLKNTLKFTKSNPNIETDINTESITSDAATSKTMEKKELIAAAGALKASSLDITSFLVGTPLDITNSIRGCLTK